LHEFFVDWFNDVLDDTDAAFARVAEVLHPSFSMVVSSGETLDRTAVLERVRGAHATADVTAPVRIEIRNLVDRVVGDDAALVTYEEWQFAGDRLQNRRSSNGVPRAGSGGAQWRRMAPPTQNSAQGRLSRGASERLGRGVGVG
jgi:hypothetical protein